MKLRSQIKAIEFLTIRTTKRREEYIIIKYFSIETRTEYWKQITWFGEFEGISGFFEEIGSVFVFGAKKAPTGELLLGFLLEFLCLRKLISHFSIPSIYLVYQLRNYLYFSFIYRWSSYKDGGYYRRWKWKWKLEDLTRGEPRGFGIKCQRWVSWMV